MNAQLLNTTFRNVGRSGELGGIFDILTVKPPELTTNFFPKPAASSSSGYPVTTSNYAAYRTPTYAPQNGTSLKLDNIFNTSSGLASQLIAAFGKRETQQITGSNAVQALVAPQQNPYGSAGQSQQIPFQNPNPQGGGVGAGALNTATDFLDGIATSFGISTTMLALFGAAGVYLLFRTPPKRR